MRTICLSGCKKRDTTPISMLLRNPEPLQTSANNISTGKLFNALSTSTWNAPYVNGWNGSDFLLDPYTYLYYHSFFQRNVGSDHQAPRNYTGEYSTDVIAAKSFDFLEDAVESGEPFFMGIAPIAPHSQAGAAGATVLKPFSEPLPAKRHEHLFEGVKIPRSPNFNPNEVRIASL